MGLIKKYQDIKDRIVINMSKVSNPHIQSEEKRISDDVLTKEDAKVHSVAVREISNGKDRYSVEDVHYSSTQRSSYSWQYGTHYDVVTAERREFTVSDGKKKTTLSFEKKDGNFFEVGDSDDKGEIHEFNVKINGEEIKLKDKKPNINLGDVNQLRHYFKDREDISYFLDKFVIVSSEERDSYKKYAKPFEDMAEIQQRADKLEQRIEARSERGDVKAVRRARQMAAKVER